MILAGAVAAVFVGQTLWPEAAPYRGALAEAALLRLGSATKLLLLGLAWHQSRRCVFALEADNPARGPWRLLSLGFLGFFLGQSVLGVYQIVLGTSPYPSPGDIFFMAAYPLLVLGAFAFVRAYREAGYPVGSRREHALLGGVLALVFLVVGVRLLGPVLAQPGPALERFLTAAYPAFDFVLLVPILILLRITAPFRGGQIFRAWSLVLLGIVALCAGRHPLRLLHGDGPPGPGPARGRDLRPRLPRSGAGNQRAPPAPRGLTHAFRAGFLGRQVSTGQGALRTTRSVVEPKRAWSSSPLPWEPSTMRSTGSSFARRMISAEGVP